jgi:hypothetical protein
MEGGRKVVMMSVREVGGQEREEERTGGGKEWVEGKDMGRERMGEVYRW